MAWWSGDARIILHLLRCIKEQATSCGQAHPTTLELPKCALTARGIYDSGLYSKININTSQGSNLRKYEAVMRMEKVLCSVKMWKIRRLRDFLSRSIMQFLNWLTEESFLLDRSINIYLIRSKTLVWILRMTLEGLEPTTFELLAWLMSRSPMRYPLRHRATHLTSVSLFTNLVNLAYFMISNIWVECGNNLSANYLFSVTEITETAKVGQFELRVNWCIKLTLVGIEPTTFESLGEGYCVKFHILLHWVYLLTFLTLYTGKTTHTVNLVSFHVKSRIPLGFKPTTFE